MRYECVCPYCGVRFKTSPPLIQTYEDTCSQCGGSGDHVAWPDGFYFIKQLRRALGLFDGAMSKSPYEAWEEAIGEINRLRARTRDV